MTEVKKIYVGGTVSRNCKYSEEQLCGQLRPDYCCLPETTTQSGIGVGFNVANSIGLNKFDYDATSQSYILKALDK